VNHLRPHSLSAPLQPPGIDRSHPRMLYLIMLQRIDLDAMTRSGLAENLSCSITKFARTRRGGAYLHMKGVSGLIARGSARLTTAP
jgi:hypothetical protein